MRHTQQSESTSHLELLTVGLTTWTGDERIKADFKYPNNWRLNISDITKADKGLYICQISTHPVKTLHVILNVQGNSLRINFIIISMQYLIQMVWQILLHILLVELVVLCYHFSIIRILILPASSLPLNWP